MNRTLAFLFFLFALVRPPVALAQNSQPRMRKEGVRIAHTSGEVQEILTAIYLDVTLDPDASQNYSWSSSALQPFADYLEFQVLGAGKTVRIDIDQAIAFLKEWRKRGKPVQGIGGALSAEYAAGRLSGRPAATRAKREVAIGGFVAAEFEHHQEPDGEVLDLVEINQIRVFFSANVNPGAERNRTKAFIEWNPVPEEVVHQIDSATLPGPPAVTWTAPTPVVPFEELLPFERAYIAVDSVAGTPLDIELGQFRNPFGIWSDYTSHRNFSSAKNNMLVNGFALKKIELGGSAGMTLPGGFEWKAAVMHGRQARTSPLSRADADDRLDVAGRVGWGRGPFEVGVSGYFAEGSTKNLAAGADVKATIGRLLVSAEGVYQRNEHPSRTFGVLFPVELLEAQSAYVQLSLGLPLGVSLYGFYEGWQLLADGEVVNEPAFKLYHGVRVQVHPRLRWTIIEVGWNDHGDFDDGKLHTSTQVEMTF